MRFCVNVPGHLRISLRRAYLEAHGASTYRDYCTLTGCSGSSCYGPTGRMVGMPSELVAPKSLCYHDTISHRRGGMRRRVPGILRVSTHDSLLMRLPNNLSTTNPMTLHTRGGDETCTGRRQPISLVCPCSPGWMAVAPAGSWWWRAWMRRTPRHTRSGSVPALPTCLGWSPHLP